MKSYSAPLPVADFERLIVPSGKELPRGALKGEIFQLEADSKQTHTVDPWYGRGVYIFNGYMWQKINFSTVNCVSTIIGSQVVELERALTGTETPYYGDGFPLSTISIHPSHLKSKITGSVSICLDTMVDRNVWVLVFRNSRVVGGSAASVAPGRLTSLTVAFSELHNCSETITYQLRLCSNKVGEIFINRGSKLVLDGMMSSAFVVQETP